MDVYFVRHGESEGNLGNFHQGEVASLSDEGKIQAKLVATRLKSSKIDIVYTSPHLRAKQTADIIAQHLGLSVEVWGQLKERKRPSEIEGLSYDHPMASKIYKITRKKQTIPDWKYSDDESFNDLLIRAKAVEKHLIENHKNQDVLCVSHIGILIMIVLYLVLQDKLTPDVYWQYYYHSRIDNTGITQLEFSEEGGWKLLLWNDTSHL